MSSEKVTLKFCMCTAQGTCVTFHRENLVITFPLASCVMGADRVYVALFMLSSIQNIWRIVLCDCSVVHLNALMFAPFSAAFQIRCLHITRHFCFHCYRFRHKNPEDPNEVPGGFITDCNKVHSYLDKIHHYDCYRFFSNHCFFPGITVTLFIVLKVEENDSGLLSNFLIYLSAGLNMCNAHLHTVPIFFRIP